jgi:DNA-binding response OmpR family regulator
MKLLIAEDDVFFVKLLGQILSPDHELVVTRDGNQAWETLQRPDAPRLAILDWVMPGMSGPEICRRVKATATLSSTYLIILTAKNSTADIVAGLRAGADDYIMKPPVPEELKARVTMGERVLALQQEVKAQSVLAHEALEREKRFREGLAAGPFYERPVVQDNLREVAAYLSRQADTSDHGSYSSAEGSAPVYGLSIPSLEHSHS